MAPKQRKPEENDKGRIEFGSPQHEAILSGGYGGMTAENAQQIIAERKENPLTHSYEAFLRAKAFLDALNATPTIISDREGWKRLG